MRRRILDALGVIATVLTVLGLAGGHMVAQGRQSQTHTLRTSWGHPDLEGTWDRHSITPLERPKEFGPGVLHRRRNRAARKAGVAGQHG
jgi:hypothetical protein